MTRGRSEDVRHLAESAFGITDLRIRQCAHELIAAVAKHKVIGAKSLSQGLGHVSKKLIPGRVSSAVVHRLQTVHIDERDHQADSLSPGPIDLVLQFSKARATPQHPGEVIDQVVPPLVAFSIEGGLGSIVPGLVPILGSLFPVQGNLLSMPLPLVCWMGAPPFKGLLTSVQLGLVAVKRLLVSIQGPLGVRWFLAAVPSHGVGISLLRPFRPLCRGLAVGCSVRVAASLGPVTPKLVRTSHALLPGSLCCMFL